MDDALEQLQPVIEPHEHVLWSGRPDPDVVFAPADVYLFLVGLYLAALGTLFTVLGYINSEGPGSQFPFGIVFIVIGLAFSFGRLYIKRRRKLKAAYALTTRRVIVLYGARALNEYPLPGGSRVTRTARNGRHMSVTFGNDVERSFFSRRLYPNTGMDFFDFGHRFPVAFYDVADVDGLKAALAKISATLPPVAQN